MKLLRFGLPGFEKPGALDAQGNIRDLSSVIEDLAGSALGAASIDALRSLDLERFPVVPSTTRLGPPVAGTRNFVGIGLNYSDHAEEAGVKAPDMPVVFLKSVGSLCGPNDDVMLPPGACKADWEVELAIVIGKRAQRVSADDAHQYIAGYTVCNDLSEREWQLERGGTWDKGKSFDTFGPVGPWLVTPDEIPDVSNLDLFLDLDGKRMQTGNTRKMIFSVPELVSYCSQCLTLEPGDIITTGTPPGVGLGKRPNIFLSHGQTMRLGVERLGEQVQRVVDPAA
ncbi:2-keto-4-pentenoate hydratase/2-oxohepta-3-ene-1,7-dioic acid hydratase in catechol pathway [Paraburkholderia sp. MM5496-R1]|uniref:fumarylacetoacetate hydrolase family protein n=1 Tax=unclassified Paraburkholderia TaxID=2615204 RepID=UPI003D232D3E